MMNLLFLLTNNSVKLVFFCVSTEMLQGQPHWVHQSVIWLLSMNRLSRISEDNALSLRLSHVNTQKQLLHCLSLIICQFGSSSPSAAQMLVIWIGWPGWASSAVCAHPWQNVCSQYWTALYNKLWAKHLFVNVLCRKSFCPQKCTAWFISLYTH